MKNHINIFLNLTEDDATEDAEQIAARRLAAQIARLLSSKVLPAAQQVINLTVNEPLYPFTIPLDTERFKASVRIADSFYSFEIKHRKGERAFLKDALFCVSFKGKDQVMFTKDRVVMVSKELGVPVYRQGFVEDETVEKYLLSDSVRGCLAKIDFQPLARLFLSPIQLQASSKLKDPVACAEQVRIFVQLMEALACARKPEKPKPNSKA